MATLTKSTGTVTLTGAVEKVTLPAVYGWVWVKNMSDSDIFAGLSADISEGADGVMTIPAGECGRLQTDGFDSVYLMGLGNALVVAQNYADCPFKTVRKGGESGGGIYPINPQTGLPYGDVTIGEGVIALVNTFKDSGVITSVKLPNSLITIGSNAFYYCQNLKTVDFAQVEEIGDYALYATGLTTAVLPETVKKIKDLSFACCYSLTRLHIPAGCISVSSSAFNYDRNLLELTVGVGFNADLCISNLGNGNLTAETINAIIANYADNSGKKLTMGSTYLAKLSDDDKAAAAAKGLTLA